jgi:fructoselysine-6-P-deglycase FrlB-like protein
MILSADIVALIDMSGATLSLDRNSRRCHAAHRRRAAEVAPMLLVQSAYRLIATLAVRRGFDLDHPAHLRKVTETV